MIGGWLLAAGLLATTVVGACADKKGALMLAITTDMKAPKDVNAVAVSITTNGLVKASFIGRVTPQGDILLPGTLAIVEPDDKNAVIRIRVMAFQNQKPRVIRDVRTTAPPDGRTALLRIPLNFVNDGKVAGSALPDGLVPDPVPGTEGLSPPASATATTGDAGSVGTKDLSPSGGDFDFMLNFQPKDCLNPQDETIINGECHDSYIDPATLPDFDAADLGDSTGQNGACFDLGKCFAGAIDTGQGNGAGPKDGGDLGPVDAGASGPDGSVDAGAKPFKDFRPATVDFDPVACTYKLNGADPARLNIAIVTPDTGECVRAGECYVPIDRGATGWQDDGAGNIQLPSYLCKFLTAKGLHLATSTDVCAAKLESNPICTPMAGDDAGIFPVGGGDGGKPNNFPIPDDYVSAVALFGPTLFFAGSARQGYVDLTNPSAMAQPVVGTAVAGNPHLPWRFGVGAGGVALANDTQTGYVLGPQGQSMSIMFSANVLDVAALGTGFTWGSTGGQGMPALIIAPPTPPTMADVSVSFVTSVAATNLPNYILVGDQSGGVSLCQPQSSNCGAAAGAGGGRVDSMVLKTPGAGYALAGDGLYAITADSGMGLTTKARIFQDATFAGVQEGSTYLAHQVAVAGDCIVFSSSNGLEFVTDVAGKKGARAAAPLVGAAPGQPILGVAIGPDMAGPAGSLVAYYTVYAPRDVAAPAKGGGVHRVSLPKECSVGGDGGTSTDAGTDAGPACGPATCPTGCCSPGIGCLTFPQQKMNTCGSLGNACMDCGVSGSCVPAAGTGGQCG